jgi:hypothetical protein
MVIKYLNMLVYRDALPEGYGRCCNVLSGREKK